MDEIEKSIKKLALLHFRTPPRVGVRAMVKLSAVFFLDESSITIGLGGGVRKCNSIKKSFTEEVNESIISIKSTIIDALKEENLKLQNKV